MCSAFITCFFFFNDTATTEIYTLSLHDALPIWVRVQPRACAELVRGRRDHVPAQGGARLVPLDRKSTRLNSSHSQISYAVFCLKKKKKQKTHKPHISHHRHTLRHAVSYAPRR